MIRVLVAAYIAGWPILLAFLWTTIGKPDPTDVMWFVRPAMIGAYAVLPFPWAIIIEEARRGPR